MRGVGSRWVPCVGRRMAVVLAAACVVLGYWTVSPALPVATAEPSPYYLVVDPLPLNPARVTPRVLAFSVGPLAAEVDSNNWTLQQIGNFLQTSPPDWNKLPPGAEELRFASQGGVIVALLGAQLNVGLKAAALGKMNEDFITFMKLASGQAPPDGTELRLDGNSARTAAWSEASVRAGIPLPFAGRLLGLGRLRVGVGLHLLQGRSYLQAAGSGGVLCQQSPPECSKLDGKVVSLTSQSGTGTAFDVGLSAELSRNVRVEVGYLGVGDIRWTSVKQETREVQLDQSGQPKLVTTTADVSDVAYPLPATLFAAVRWRAMGPLELAASYARVDVGRPEHVFSRLNGEARFNLFFVRTALGAVQDENRPTRLYARLGVGPLTVGLLNLEEAFKGGQGKSLGLAAQLSFGI